jgi:hypothetical protein
MRRSIGAGVTLIALLAALVPGGLAPFFSGGSSACCLPGHCAMLAGRMSMPGKCYHAMGADASLGSSACECRVSQAPGSAVPPTAFRFTFNLVVTVPLSLHRIDVHLPVAGIAVPLQGYTFPLDQPPRV